MKTLTVRLEEDLHKKFKMYSVESGKDMQALLLEYIEKLVEEKKNNSTT